MTGCWVSNRGWWKINVIIGFICGQVHSYKRISVRVCQSVCCKVCLRKVQYWIIIVVWLVSTKNTGCYMSSVQTWSEIVNIQMRRRLKHSQAQWWGHKNSAWYYRNKFHGSYRALLPWCHYLACPCQYQSSLSIFLQLFRSSQLPHRTEAS